MNTKKGLTFKQIVAIEPRLGDLLKEAQSFHETAKGYPNFCANEHFYGYGSQPGMSLKHRVVALVGWMSPRPELQTRQAYDEAYNTIYDALPDCRGKCACRVVQDAIFGICDTAYKITRS